MTASRRMPAIEVSFVVSRKQTSPIYGRESCLRQLQA
jgi:hypothetical protein